MTTIEEPDVVTPHPANFSPSPLVESFRKYDVNVWTPIPDREIRIVLYQVSLEADDPETISGTDYDSAEWTYSVSPTDPEFEATIAWLADLFGFEYVEGEAPDFDEWHFYDGVDCDFSDEAPAEIKEWLDKLPAYEPRLV